MAQRSSRTTSRRCSPSRRIDALIAARPDPAAADGATSLLQVLLRHALLREIAEAAARLAGDAAGRRRSPRCCATPSSSISSPARAPTTHLAACSSIATCPPITGGADDPRSILEGLTDVRRRRPLRALGEFRAQPRASAGARQRDAAAPDAGHARPLVAPARRLDHLVRDQAPGGDARARSRTGLRVGGYGWVENLRPAPAAATPVHAARRRSRRRCSRRRRQRLHPRAVDDARRDRGAAAQRAPRRRRRRRSATGRSRSTCRRGACASRRGCSTACARASRSARCSATASSAACTSSQPRRVHRAACASSRRSSPASSSRPTQPADSDRREQRRRRPACCSANGPTRQTA